MGNCDELKKLLLILLFSVYGTIPYSFLKVHKRENFLGSDIEICTFS
jgi:hypothetical protein